jgi:hypothetical protein
MTTHLSPDGFVERVELSGHIIDSLLLPKVLDHITAAGGRFQIEQITVGQARRDPSFAVIAVHAPSAERLAQILADIADHGAVPVDSQDARLVAADIAGAFPEGFYSTTNQRTEVRLAGQWIEVQDQEMDCGRFGGPVCPLHRHDRREARSAVRHRPRGSPRPSPAA